MIALRRILILSAFSLTGCVQYEAAPVDWTEESRTLADHPRSRTLSVADVRVRAVAFDRDLNVLRLRRAAAKDKALASGWWEDPSLNVDFLRILKEPENPLVYGGSLSFTLPLSGIPAVEHRAAEAYAAADYWEVVAAERTTAGEAAVRAVTAQEIAVLIDLIAMTLDGTNYVSALESSRRMVDVGELSRTDYEQLRADAAQWRMTQNELGHERLEAERDLRARLALAPDSELVWQVEMPVPCPTNDFPLLAFTNAPSVRAGVARLAGGECELDREIRRQYPELSVGPAYSREDGLDRVGFTAGLTLPLWNRNRVGIATAKGARNVLRQQAVDAWCAAVRAWAELKLEERRLHTVLKASAQDASPLVRNDDRLERLYALGELDAPGYVGSVHRRLTEEVTAMRQRIDRRVLGEKMKTVIESLTFEGVEK